MSVSVIIPTYNSAPLISKAINSVLNQTYQDFEIIIIDDGSTDNTAEVIETFKDSRIKYIKQENAGPAQARNNGIQSAKGEYIAFLDADDTWTPDKLELQLEAFKTYPDVSMVYSGLEIRNFDETYSYTDSFRNFDNNLKLLRYLFFHHVAIMPAVMIKKSILDEVGHFNPELYTGEDWDLWLRLANKSNFHYIDKSLVIRYKPNTSITSRADYSVTERCHKTVLDSFFALDNLEPKIKKLKSRAYSFIYYDVSRLHFYRNRKKPPIKTVLRTFFKSFSYDPVSYFTRFDKGKFLVRIIIKLTVGY